MSRIISLKAENIKRLKAFDITPTPHINRISGGNGSGKTSALDSIEWAFAGTSNVPTQPVRKGAGKARIVAETEEYRITRTFTEGGSRNGMLKLESKSRPGMFHQGPQEILDKLMGKISFDPLEFLRMKPAKQLEVLRSIVKTDVDLDQLQSDYNADYLRRREAKKERDQIQIRADAIAVPADLPAKKVDEAALIKELQEASSYNEGIARQQGERDKFELLLASTKDEYSANADTLKKLREEIELIEQAQRENRKAIKIGEERIASWEPLPEPKDSAKLADAITKARADNQGIDRRTRREEYQKEINALDTEIQTLSDSLKDKDDLKMSTIAKAEFPVPGLAFGDEEVIYEGIPFAQVSNADQIRASVAIGMATNPEFRVMRIKDGSLLDDKSMAILAGMAKDFDFQVFIEQVDTSGKVGIYLEDGEVIAINPEPLNEPEPTAAPAPKTRRKKGTPASV